MRNVMKAATLESKFPILSVEHDCIISKDADITVCYRVELPELFTVTQAEYEAIHSAWAKAVKVLPNYSIVHKQDFFIEESYTPELQKEDLSFLSRSFERHFNERPYLKHTCYLFLTKTTKEHSRTTSSFNALTRGFIIPKEMQDKEAVSRFLECCEQFERIINDSGFITLTRLTGDEITGTESSAGIIEKYFSLSQEDTTCLQDITLGAGEMKIGDNYLCLHTLSDPEDLPTSVATDSRYERLPSRLKGVSRDAVWYLGRNSAGLYIRFRSNSSSIHLRWESMFNNTMNHMTDTGTKGMDLYTIHDGGWRHVCSARPTGRYNTVAIIRHMDPVEREYMLYLPLYEHHLIQQMEMFLLQDFLSRNLSDHFHQPETTYIHSLKQQQPSCREQQQPRTHLSQQRYRHEDRGSVHLQPLRRAH